MLCDDAPVDAVVAPSGTLPQCLELSAQLIDGLTRRRSIQGCARLMTVEQESLSLQRQQRLPQFHPAQLQQVESAPGRSRQSHTSNSSYDGERHQPQYYQAANRFAIHDGPPFLNTACERWFLSL